jgi:hypothetical protein
MFKSKLVQLFLWLVIPTWVSILITLWHLSHFIFTEQNIWNINWAYPASITIVRWFYSCKPKYKGKEKYYYCKWYTKSVSRVEHVICCMYFTHAETITATIGIQRCCRNTEQFVRTLNHSRPIITIEQHTFCHCVIREKKYARGESEGAHSGVFTL